MKRVPIVSEERGQARACLHGLTPAAQSRGEETYVTNWGVLTLKGGVVIEGVIGLCRGFRAYRMSVRMLGDGSFCAYRVKVGNEPSESYQSKNWKLENWIAVDRLPLERVLESIAYDPVSEGAIHSAKLDLLKRLRGYVKTRQEKALYRAAVSRHRVSIQ